MGEGLDTRGAPLEARFESVLREVDDFRPREPHRHPNLFGGEASIPFERIFAAVARGREALDLAIGEGLCALQDRDGFLSLGYSKLTDYAREALGLPASTAREKVKLAPGLRSRPLLAEAVRSGRLSARKALEALPVARGDAEGPWLLLAATVSVRGLREAVGRALGRPAEGAAAAGALAEEERWKLLFLPLRPVDRRGVDEAMRLAGKLLGPGAPAWQRLEAIAQEFLGWHPTEPGEGERAGPANGVVRTEELEKALEIESRGWDWLEAVAPVAAPDLGEREPEALDARLRDLVEGRERWDELFGLMARAFLRKGLARQLGFASLGQYARERLGTSRRAVEQRAWLERRMEELPQLRYAFERGEVSYEKARLLAGVADFDSVNGWIGQARSRTCAELERLVEAARDAQACARGRLEAGVPERVAGLVRAALRRRGAECGAAGPGGVPREGRLALRRDLGAAPPAAEHARAAGRRAGRRVVPGPGVLAAGGPRPPRPVPLPRRGRRAENRVALCAPHHLRGIHRGLLRVSGSAPDALVWELGPLRPRGPVGLAC